MSETDDDITAIIPCHNVEHCLRATIDALVGSSLVPKHVLLVNDGSVDTTARVMQDLAAMHAGLIRCLDQEAGRQGAGAARTYATIMADTSKVLFLDADVVVERDAIRIMRDHLLRSECSAVVALYKPFSLQPGVLSHFQAFVANDAFLRLPAQASPCFGTQCALVWRSSVLALGGFGREYCDASIEDFEFGYRLRQRGEHVTIARDAAIIHNHFYNIKSFVSNYYRKTRDLTLLLLMSPSIPIHHAGYWNRSRCITVMLGVICLGLTLVAVALNLSYGLSVALLGCVAGAVSHCGATRELKRLPRPQRAAFRVIYALVSIVASLGIVAAWVVMSRRKGFVKATKALITRIVDGLSKCANQSAEDSVTGRTGPRQRGSSHPQNVTVPH